MSHTLFTGRLVRLSAPDPEQHAGEIARWGRDPEFLTLLSTGIARPWSAAAVKKELQENLGDDEPRVGVFPFVIHTLAAAGQPERLVGFIDLSLGGWAHRDAWIGVGIGQREDWGKGYGSDAVRLICGYAFDELNLHRVSLTVFEYNERAIRAYRKLGFVEEGRQREYLRRFGRRWDMLVMGLLHADYRAERAAD